jgi:hypothetical protein
MSGFSHPEWSPKVLTYYDVSEPLMCERRQPCNVRSLSGVELVNNAKTEIFYVGSPLG